MTIVNKKAINYNKIMISYAPFWKTLKDRGAVYVYLDK